MPKSGTDPVGTARSNYVTLGSYCPPMTPTPANLAAVRAVLADLDTLREPAPEQVKEAVRALLSRLGKAAPGRSVEVRVPPYGAIQCVAGPRHTRGTPPNVVETDPLTWIALATGRLAWSAAVADGRVRASGVRADLTGWLPLLADTDD